MPLIANIVLFQIGWFGCVLGAANGLAWVGSGLALIIAGLHLQLAQHSRVELKLLLIAVMLGYTWDSAITMTGLIAFTGGGLAQGLAPHWMAALWLVFATTLNVSMRWLRGRWLLAALFGAIGGPLSYYAGAQLGAISFPDLPLGLATQAVGWAVLMPLLLRLSVRFDGIHTRKDVGPAYV